MFRGDYPNDSGMIEFSSLKKKTTRKIEAEPLPTNQKALNGNGQIAQKAF